MIKQDRAIVGASLVVVALLSWIYLFVLAVEMARGDKSLMGMGSMKAMGNIAGAMATDPQPWGITTFILMLVMWWVMMIGMMIPSAMPMILVHARVQRKRHPEENLMSRSGIFTLGYGVAWFGFALVATLLQWALSEAALISPMMVATSRYLGVAIFLAAGAYQLTPLKHICLANCRSPIHFLTTHWRNGRAGVLRMGIDHGTYCVGCCWFLMAILFFGGVMNLLWVAAIAIFVMMEKLIPRGDLVSRISGVLMLGFAGYLIAEPWLA
ncbi:MAG: DUF2182 domain-containing protein [Alphaproteobacteria bacterium]|nr:DUF2182 domain-containing protein [Alphaproteobacteria bacterium]